MSDKFFLVVGIITLALGCITMISLIYTAMSCKEKITATVSKVSKKKMFWKGKNFLLSSPTFTYDYNGNKYTSASNISTLKKGKYKKGDMVEIKINPKNPKMIVAGFSFSSLLIGICSIVIGMVLIWAHQL